MIEKAGPILLGSALFLAACGHESAPLTTPATTEQGPVDSVSASSEVIWSADFPTTQAPTVEQSINRYVTAYGCPDTKITVSLGKFVTQTDAQGNSLSVQAETTANHIVYNDALLPTFQPKELENLTLHEMTHACTPPEATMFASPIALPDGAVATGVQGFGILVELPNGEQTKFMKVEEGVAEAEAVSSKPDYEVPSESYFHVGSLMLDDMKKHGITSKQLAKMIQTSNLEDFVNSTGDPSQSFETNLITAMNRYNAAFTG